MRTHSDDSHEFKVTLRSADGKVSEYTTQATDFVDIIRRTLTDLESRGQLVSDDFRCRRVDEINDIQFKLVK